MTQVTETLLALRKKYARPQALLFANEVSSKIVNGVFVWLPHGVEGKDWIILSDHARSEINMNIDRIENRRRMIDATMRSYYTADKTNVSLSWSELPSKSSLSLPAIRYGTLLPTPNGIFEIPPGCLLTVDGGAGGSELKDWYDTHTEPFFVLFAYDDYKSVVIESNNPDDQFKSINHYKLSKMMYFSSFDYDIVKRHTYIKNKADGSLDYKLEFDLWNVSIALEEV